MSIIDDTHLFNNVFNCEPDISTNDFINCDLTSCLIEVNYVKTLLFDLEKAYEDLKISDDMYFRTEFIKQVNSLISSYMLFEETELMTKFKKHLRKLCYIMSIEP